ncbi:MAG: FtsX-like permease family protein [Planctomycetota bacterium]|nr:MAG: FtsX-like permease family protein [Planctomycetota bacterium]
MPHFSTLWKYSAREVRRRPGRSILTLLGIVFGVAAIVAITITTSTTHTAFRSMFEAVAGRAALEVVPSGQGGFDAHVLAAVRAVDGVQAAVPVVQTPAVLLGARGGAGVLVLGIDPRADQQVRTYELREGRLLDDTDGLLLEAGFAQAQGVSLGQRVRLMTPAAESGGILAAPLPVVGLLELDGAATFNGGAVAFMPLATAQRSFGFHERINSIQIVLAEGADAATVQALLQPNLPAGLSVQAPASRGGLAQDSLLSTELGLGSLSVVSLVAGAFVILNAFLMNLGERRRQFAILRALGATRRQVTRLLLREAAFFVGAAARDHGTSPWRDAAAAPPDADPLLPGRAPRPGHGPGGDLLPGAAGRAARAARRPAAKGSGTARTAPPLAQLRRPGAPVSCVRNRAGHPRGLVPIGGGAVAPGPRSRLRAGRLCAGAAADHAAAGQTGGLAGPAGARHGREAGAPPA